jgi:hypothetical protein
MALCLAAIEHNREAKPSMEAPALMSITEIESLSRSTEH